MIAILDLLTYNPPQAKGVGKHHELVTKKGKAGVRQPLGKNISNLIMCRDIFDRNIMINYLFSNEMIINFNMLSLSMIDRIGSKSYSTKVITSNYRSHE